MFGPIPYQNACRRQDKEGNWFEAPYCISGGFEDENGWGGGVLFWAYSLEEAREVMSQIQGKPGYTNLSIDEGRPPAKQGDNLVYEPIEMDIQNGKLTLRVGPQFMTRCGTNTVIGALANKYDSTPLFTMRELTLEMVQTTRSWKEKHGGPNHWIMPEHAVQCFVENLLQLQQEGVKITFVEHLENPS